jgi:hypothetical protein
VSRSLRFVCTFALVTSCAASLGAQPAQPNDGVARDLMKRGQDAARRGSWQEAYDAFRAAWGLVQDHAVACNLAQASIKLERRVEAAERSRDCLNKLPPGTKPEHRKRAEDGYEQARAEVGSLKITVEPDGAEVMLDGKGVGTAPIADEIFVEAGPHTIEAKHATLHASKQEVLAQPSQPGAAPGPSHGSNPASSGDTQEPQPPTGGLETRTIALIAGGALTLVAVGAGIGFKLAGSSAHDDADAALAQAKSQFGDAPCATPAGASSDLCAEIRDKRDQGDSANQISNISFYAAGAFAVGTAAVFLFWPKESATTGVRAAPWVTGAASGVTLSGAF